MATQKQRELFGEKIVVPLLVTLLTPLAISIGSKINTGNWLEWFSRIPTKAWVLGGVIIFLWFTLVAVRKRTKQIKQLNAGPGLAIGGVPLYGFIELGELDYAQVIWRVRAPAPFPWETYPKISPSSIDVETPPRCPRCKTELEELHSFWGGYIWRCVVCMFRKKSRDSYYREADRAEKVARSQWEKQNHRDT